MVFRLSFACLLFLLTCAPLAQSGDAPVVSGAMQTAIDDAENQLHLKKHYALALVAYNKIIAQNPDWLHPRFLRWILLVDMGALSILENELGVKGDLPFHESLDNAVAHLPPAIRINAPDARQWLERVVLRYYEIRPTHAANRGDMDLAVHDTQHALVAPNLPRQLDYELRENLVVYLSDANRFAEVVEAAAVLEKKYGEPVIGILNRQANALESLGKHTEAIRLYERILERNSGNSFAENLNFWRDLFIATRNSGNINKARELLQKINEQTKPPEPRRMGCAPDWSGDYAWVRLQEIKLLLQENQLAQAEQKLADIEVYFGGSPEVSFLRANLEHLKGNPQAALAFYNRLNTEETDPDTRIEQGRLAAARDLDPQKKLFEKDWNPNAPWEEGEMLVLCYHDIPDMRMNRDVYAVDVETFVSHLELLKARGFHFVRLSDVVNAHKNKQKLPAKSVLLTFDDGYKTQHDNLLPILELYQAPAVFAVVTHWIGSDNLDAKPDLDLCQFAPFMTANELREAAQNPLIEIACHSHDLHHAVPINPFGNTAPAATAHQWVSGVYETDAQYEARITHDLQTNIKRIQEITGRTPIGIAWPFGAQNVTTQAIAEKLGLEALMDLGNGTFHQEDYPNVARFLVFHSMRQSDFSREIGLHTHDTPPIRGEYLPLDGLVTRDDAVTSKNLDVVVSDLMRRFPSHVLLDISSTELGACYPTDYKGTDGEKIKYDWVSHIARALEMRDMGVILRITEKDKGHLDDILKLPVGENIFLDFAATPQDVSKVESMRKEGHVLVRLGGPANADFFVCSGVEDIQKDFEKMDSLIFWCSNEQEIVTAAAAGAQHWIGSTPTRFNTTKTFTSRPPSDPRWIMIPLVPLH